MDSDLQDEPEVIAEMLAKAKEGNDVVYAVKETRPEGPLLRAAFGVYYRLAGRFSDVVQPRNAGPFCLMSRRAVDAVLTMPERGVFFPGVRAWVGYPQTGVSVDRPEREGGRSRIPLRRRISGALDGLFAFSKAPLRFAVWLGFVVAGLTGLLELFFIYFKLFTDIPIKGFTALITAILFLGGVQLLTIGIIGEYLGRVFDEVKQRPRYVVEERLNLPEPPA
jgi:dolichol-phosphate mannosyltransferase